ncbi:MAG TPA: glycosyltransferase family 39 protein, partial [Terriglobales bacterium]|nr:glycosyltransferase family 39 protein [Terriglobales bacterium]
MAVKTLTSQSAAPAPATVRAQPRSGWRDSFFWMVAAGFLLRLAAILILHTYRYRSAEGHFDFGYEMGRIAAAIASGHGFSNPFQTPTGPTAWEPPLYPYLTAGIFKLFGIYSYFSAFVLLTLNSFFSALTAIPVYLIGKRTFGYTVAVWSGWMWAVLPFTMYWSTKWVWETSFSALLLALIFLVALMLQEAQGWRLWAALGALWGVAALTNPSLVSFLPVSLGWIWVQRKKRHGSWLPGTVLALLIFAALVTPWITRNYQVFGKFIFIRDNFGCELRLGNGPGADGTWMWYLHPTQNVLQMREFQRLGEVAYIAERKQQALAFIAQNPTRFIELSAKRFVYYWAGLPRSSKIAALAPIKNSLFLASSILALWGLARALRKRVPGATLFGWLILVYPAVYYLVFPHPRYRHPIEPEMLLLGVYLISQVSTKNRTLVKPVRVIGDPRKPITTLSVVMPVYNEKATI